MGDGRGQALLYLSGNANSALALYADELEDAQLADGDRALKRIMQILESGPD